ncbi:MAG TPA: recombinase family protein [Acidimicrobiales bacterium]|nr:recombinase family protein [Acidimicrobiales bacterium]
MSTRPKERLALRYRRMSFDDSEEQLRRQAEDVDAICELHDYRTKAEWLFTDDDESGNEDTRYRQRKGERPGLAALDATVAELTAQGHAVTVVAWVPSRLFRDAGHKEHYFRRWARCGDVQVHTKQGVWNPKDPRDRFVSTIVAGTDQYYSDDVREKVVRAHDDRRASGLPATGWPGFGHVRACGCGSKSGRCASPKHDRWIADKKEAALIRDAAKRLVVGTTNLSTLAGEWQAKGFKTRLGGDVWRLTSLRKTLLAPRVAGILVHNGKEMGRSDAIEPIVDEALYRRLVGALNQRNHGPGSHRTKQLLTGLLVCGVCGRTLNSNMKRGSQGLNNLRVYGCRWDGQCNIKAEAVERVYVEKMFERLDDPRFTAALERVDDESDRLLTELHDQDAELETLKAAADRLPADVYIAKYEAIATRIDELQRRIGVTGTTSVAGEWAGKSKQLRRVWEQTLSTDEKRALLAAIVGQSTVLPAEKRGRYATDDEVKARLVPLVGEAETRERRRR